MYMSGRVCGNNFDNSDLKKRSPQHEPLIDGSCSLFGHWNEYWEDPLMLLSEKRKKCNFISPKHIARDVVDALSHRSYWKTAQRCNALRESELRNAFTKRLRAMRSDVTIPERYDARSASRNCFWRCKATLLRKQLTPPSAPHFRW